jgi:1,4-alpha-glucan branching enzyme
MPGDAWQKFANLRLLYAYMYAHPGKKLLFMGAEFGQWNEWDCHESLHWHLARNDEHRNLQNMLSDLNGVYRNQPALYEVDFSWDGFDWIDVHDSEQSILSFVRKAKDGSDCLVCILHYTPVPREGYRVGVPGPGLYREVFNSDAAVYGGGNIGNGGGVVADAIPWQGYSHSCLLTLPPLGALFLKPE